jgi:hypothetical protein
MLQIAPGELFAARHFRDGRQWVLALARCSFEVEKGEFVA